MLHSLILTDAKILRAAHEEYILRSKGKLNHKLRQILPPLRHCTGPHVWVMLLHEDDIVTPAHRIVYSRRRGSVRLLGETTMGEGRRRWERDGALQSYILLKPRPPPP